MSFAALGLLLIQAASAGVVGSAHAAAAGLVGSADSVVAPPPIAAAMDSVTPVDSVRTLQPIVVTGRRVRAGGGLDQLPGQTTVVDLAAERDRIATTADVLDRVPGLLVSDYGSLGTFSTVSIRGSAASQVSVYLDGVPLVRAGLGVVNLADLPFASLDRIEVFRGFAPAELAGASLGGAINLATRSASPYGRPRRDGAFVAGAGSFGTRRLGFSQELVAHGWSALAVADHLESDGDFTFLDDNGTALAPQDDEVVPRRNNWVRADEILVRVARALPGQGEIRVLDQWVRRERGVPGIASFQSMHARGGTSWNLANLEVRYPGLAGGRVGASGRVFYEWRRDSFLDAASEIGLGYQDNHDETETFGVHAGSELRLPLAQKLVVHTEARRETFLPWRRFPSATLGPEQERTTLELGIDDRLQLGALALHGGLRARRQDDIFAGTLRTPYSQRPAHSERRDALEPRAGVELRVLPGLAVRGTWGRYERAPGFLELFGDGGSVAGSSDLVPEEGTKWDAGVSLGGSVRGIEAAGSIAHFEDRVEHLILFLPQSQRTFVARNIGAAHIRGEEMSLHLADAGAARRWSLDGALTRLDARDTSTDITWYNGKFLPGRPELRYVQRTALRFGRVDLGWTWDVLGRNWLDRWNRELVARRDLHGFDARTGWRGIGLRAELRNATDERAVDVAGFPLPGRMFLLTTSYTY